MPNIRKNGLTKPYAPLQMITWFIWPLLVIQFLFFVSPVLPIAASIPCTLVHMFFALASAYYSYYCTVTDPMDPLLRRHLAEQKNSNNSEDGGSNTLDQEFKQERTGFLFSFFKPKSYAKSAATKGGGVDAETENDDDASETKHCWACETQVHSHAMHCKYCDKCVAHFDHHCQWLNNCIGEANYPYFYAILWAITFMLLIHLVLMIAIVVDNFVASEKRGDDWFNAGVYEAVVSVNLLFCVLTTIALSLVLQLLWFHLGLRKEGLTTYQYIVRDSAQKREQSRKEAAEKSRRLVAIANAKQNKKHCLAWRLDVCELQGFNCCDPLKPEEEEADNEKQESPAS
mmetsp:Transcript_5093/g.7155  ORF Transcript_5093/g.7155 Transcript_5093/m.7155 type:complete len:343 (+) Transcript_5093:184-1212(+)